MHIPIATYRLQFNADFRLKNAIELIPYLNSLGISDIYSSPLTCAMPGSKHGYDVIDPTRLNPEICNFRELKKFTQLLHRANMWLIIDFVPNHMAAAPQNKWWQDVLKKGKNSAYAHFFDIHWRNKHKFSYRRFFDINELVCLRIEDRVVFNEVHALLWKLVQQNLIDGLRLDHIDGLYNPTQYLTRLNKRITKFSHSQLYIIAEKILAFDDRLPPQWNIAGTTGYDFLDAVNSISIEKKGYQQLVENYQKFTGLDYGWPEIRYQSKKNIIQELFQTETDQLVSAIMIIAKKDQVAHQCQPQEFKHVIEEFTASLPLYRTYINSTTIHKDDQRYLLKTARLVRKKLGKKFHTARKFLEKVLFLKFPVASSQIKQSINWVMDWQQYTGPIMAKGFEDTACYVYNPLVSLNEVGSDPRMEKNYGDANVLHKFLKNRQRYTPHSLNATSTHDTKRSEDVRARLNILSELADEWIFRLRSWSRQVKSIKVKIDHIIVPDPNVEILLYQNLLGTWPISVERIKDFMIKAVREAKINTSWKQPNQSYESALLFFIDSLLEHQIFLKTFIPFQKKIAVHGALNSLSQLLIKMTAPGIPDFYQGTGLWSFSLVDPDNREPVDFSKQKLLLEELKNTRHTREKVLKDLCHNWPDGRIKLFLTYQTLEFRQQNSAIFQHGRYIPLSTTGLHKLNIFSFSRYFRKNWIIIITPRYTTHLNNASKLRFSKKSWGDTELILPKNAPTHWKNIYTNEIISAKVSDGIKTLPVTEIFKKFPVALLIGTFLK